MRASPGLCPSLTCSPSYPFRAFSRGRSGASWKRPSWGSEKAPMGPPRGLREGPKRAPGWPRDAPAPSR
eukprot:5646519-Pyramimonas_sp.AAC.1